jgi:hypothetical protein
VEAGFDIAGRLELALGDLPERDAATLTRAFDPYLPREVPAAPDVIVERLAPSLPALIDIQRDAGDGRLTGTDGERFYVLGRGRRYTVPPLGGPPPARFAYEPGFPSAGGVARMIRPAMQVALHRRGAVAVHGAAVAVEGRAVIVAGWSESGKTETALALTEAGASFLSDKWTVVAEDLTTAAFPIGVGVRGWTLEYLPRLRAALEPHARGRLLAAGWARAALRPLRSRGPVERAVVLADRVSLPPTAVRRAYAEPAAAPWQAPLALLALLTTVPDGTPVEVRPADPRWAAARLARSADFERRGLFELHDRAAWALADRDPRARERIRAHEQAFLEAVLARAEVIEVRSPFPADPRPVADAIARHL